MTIEEIANNVKYRSDTDARIIGLLCQYIKIHHGYGVPYEELTEARKIINEFLDKSEYLGETTERAAAFECKMQFKDKIAGKIEIKEL